MFKYILLITYLALVIPEILCTKDELQQQMMTLFKACKIEHGVSDDTEARWFKGDRSMVDEDLRCSALCIFTKGEVMDDAGNINVNKLKELVQLDPPNADKYLACVDKAKTGSPCQKAYDFLECTFNVLK